jgi:hypothetical protein
LENPGNGLIPTSTSTTEVSDWYAVITNATNLVQVGTSILNDDFHVENTSYLYNPCGATGIIPAPEPTTLLFGLAIACVIGVKFIPKKGLSSLESADNTLAV